MSKSQIILEKFWINTGDIGNGSAVIIFHKKHL